MAANAYQPYAVNADSLIREIEEREAQVMHGQISMRDEDRRQGKKGASGSFTAYLRPDNWSKLLELAFGKLNGGNPVLDQPTELQLFNVEIDKVGDIYRAVNCRSSRFTVRSAQDDGHLTLQQEVLGQDMIDNVNLTATSATLPVAPIVQHYESALAINGTVVEPISFEISVDHVLDGNIYRNSQTRRAMKRGRRRVTGTFELDNNATTKAILATWHNNQPFGWQIVYTNGSDVLTFQSHTPASAGARLLGDVPDFQAGNGTNNVRLPFKGVSTNAGDDELLCTIAT